MDFPSSVVLFLVSCTLIRCLCSLVTARSKKGGAHKLPPGPIGLPVVGDLLKIGKSPHKSLAELAAKYGPLMTLRLGQQTAIVASSPAMVKQVLRHQDHSLSGRAVPDAMSACDHHKFSLIFSPVSAGWRNLRRICSSNVFDRKTLDAGKHLRRQKVDELVAFLKEMGRAGVGVDIGQAVFVTSLNLLSNTFFSEDLARLGSERAQELRELVLAMTEAGGGTNVADYFPMLRLLDPQGLRRRSEVALPKFLAIFDGVISERFKSWNGPHKDKLSDTRDVLDKIIHMAEETNIQHFFADMFAAGTDTTSITLEWAIAELMRNPTILSKARSEIEQNVGKGRAIDESDMAQLPYLQAIVKETLRLHPAAPLLVPHRAEAEVEICGYVVPKHAQVLVNAWNVARDPTLWSSPNEFRPERFLGSGTDVRGWDLELIPFGSGRRICPGLPLAMRMMELTLASLIQCFDWRLEDGSMPEDMDMEDCFHIVLKKAVPLRVVPVLLL